ncbi:hypothetical protein GCM10009534_66770 [Kribbella sandramycini]|uniref:Uncharacterized protein n=1 Tax=Kribbella sandramycini TaxID=60450 RepID=A0A841SU80_9ACTN|nr:hypothetical protein [Kribbella sandramycini]
MNVHPALVRILRRRHRKLDRTLRGLIREVTEHCDAVRRELPESESHYSYGLEVYNDIHNLQARLEAFRETWIGDLR